MPKKKNEFFYPFMNQPNFKNSQKGRKKNFNDYIYNFDKKCKKFNSWRCVRRDCTGRLHTNIQSNEVMNNPVHWHEKEYARILLNDINESLKSAAINTTQDFSTTL
ncbi:hypothetical protein DMUE_1485 [Dictyocoela muelleri]|nr:hypothetical protein DMUE_1485 [Dictyocoela muelleri]